MISHGVEISTAGGVVEMVRELFQFLLGSRLYRVRVCFSFVAGIPVPRSRDQGAHGYSHTVAQGLR